MFGLKKNCILNKNEFSKVYSSARTYADTNLVIYVVKNSSCNGKVGFAAGKKLGCAVVRNRVKRILREAYRLCKPNLRSDCAIILVGRKPLIDAKTKVATESFLGLCKRAKIWIG